LSDPVQAAAGPATDGVSDAGAVPDGGGSLAREALDPGPAESLGSAIGGSLSTGNGAVDALGVRFEGEPPVAADGPELPPQAARSAAASTPTPAAPRT
ncbi:MAG: hypothetical protein ACJ767_08820, partial [Chloroflexota bacterium]